ncbi:unnamed protein product [Phytophthora lilii]|uniref:Unnamed protein product n=1 Tax=Phytophthora lilii TaxID=2077276 RepID=A0A9W6TV41_9STRA|nr:unnamed protein product [Phytophthora lilii]
MWRLLYQAGLGLEYIHKKSVVHGDLKLNNILVGADGRAKLSDFGLSAVKTSSVLSETEGEAAFTAGALRWRAPECMKKAPTFASDVYSFAMCIIEAVSGEPPFAFLDDDSVHEKLRNGEIPEKPAHMSTEAWELVVAMTNADPEQRIGLSQVLAKLKALSGDEGRTLLQSNKKAATSGTPSLREDISPGAVGPQLDIDMIVDLLDNMATQEKGEQEQMLLQLVQLCVKDEDRPVMYEANAIHILTDLVKNGRTYNTKLYALQCLKWSAIFDSKLSRPEFDALRASVPEAPVKDLSSLVNCMKTGSDHEQEKAVIRCACIATRGLGGIFRDVAVLQPLVALWQSVSDAQKLWLEMTQPLASFLQSGNSTLKLWAAEVIGSLVWGNEAIRAEIMRAEVVHPLVGLLRVGTNEQKHRASYALQYIALQKEANEMIVRKGGVEPLIALTGLGTIQQKQTTTALLESLVVSKYVNNAVIHREKSISMLVALLLVGSGEQKETAAAALVNLLETDESRAEVARNGGIPPLLKLLRAGTNSQKGYAAGALMNLASNQEARQEISREGGVAELVELTWSGNEQQKTCAVGALSHLSSNVNIGASVARSGGVDSLLELARIGTNQQRDYAISAIRNLTTGDEVHTEIVNQGGVKTFIDLLQSGTDHQKDGAVRILMNLSTNDAARSEIVSKGGVSPLLKLMQTGTDEQKELIASGLGNLAHSDEGRSEIARGGGIGPLVGLLRSGSEQQKVYAVETIETLAKSNEKIRAELVREGSVPLLKAMGKSGSEQQRESAARALQQLNGGCCSLM